MRTLPVVVLGFSLLAPSLAHADVKTQEKTQVKLEGAIGRMVSMFGGKGAREGVVSSVALKGDRMLTMSGDTGQIIDLKEEKVYDLNLKDKTYTVITFAEMRKRMEEAMAKAKKDAAAAKPEPEEKKPASNEPKKEYEVDFTIVNGDATKQVAGLNTRESIATITVREKGKTLEQGGGLVLETHLWMTPKVAALQELNAFRQRFAEKVYGPIATEAAAAAAPSMAQVMAMYPQMKDGLAKMADEAKKLNGTPLLTEMIVSVAAPPDAEGNSQAKSEPAPSIGGLLGGLGRLRKKKEEAPAAGAAAPTPGRTTVLTSTVETLEITPAASDADVAVPAGLKLRQ